MNYKILRYLIIPMISGWLISGGDIARLAKLQGLVEHYKEHKERSGIGLSFFDFLADHYNPFSKHRSEEQHDQLPGYHGIGEAPITLFAPRGYALSMDIEHAETKSLPEKIALHLPLKGLLMVDLLLDPPRQL